MRPARGTGSRRPVGPAGPARRAAARTGQAIAEAALILPVLLLLLIAIIELGAAWQTWQVVTNAAREGARVAVTPTGTPADVDSTVVRYLRGGGLDPEASIRSYACDGSPGAICTGAGRTGRTTLVEVAHPFEFRSLGPLLRLVCGGCGEGWGTVPLRSAAIMRNE